MPSTDNPFDHSRLARLEYRFPAGQSWQTLLARCAATEYCCAIVGPPGSGKRLLLHELAARLAALGFRPRPFRLTLETRRADKDALLAEVREMRAPDLLFLDGAEHLQTREWLPLRTAINGLAGAIITLHRTGRLPTLLDTTTSPALLAELATELTDGRLPVGEAALIHTRHHGDLRLCLRELRDRWAGA
ncbi:MAG: ATP-binding protein [Verrucomicrobia bacterium]|nr:MAG: ATP-binding protein [Verrucomicrobiota bacterium]